MISIAAWLRTARLRFPGPRDLPWKQGPVRVLQRRRSYEDVNVKPHRLQHSQEEKKAWIERESILSGAQSSKSTHKCCQEPRTFQAL